MKEEILKQFNGLFCTIDDINAFVLRKFPEVSRKTVVWNVNELVKKGKAVRVGRGVYGFVAKPAFKPSISVEAKKACSMILEKYKYLDVTITDTSVLNQFMNLQPFSTVITLEIRKSATEAILAALRQSGIDAYAKKDFMKVERYVSTSQPIVIRAELLVNPNLPCENNVCAANLEKTLVDLVCDEDIYGQYQGEELENIYQNATKCYAINYSQLLKYASARKKKQKVVDILKSTNEFTKVMTLL